MSQTAQESVDSGRDMKAVHTIHRDRICRAAGTKFQRFMNLVIGEENVDQFLADQLSLLEELRESASDFSNQSGGDCPDKDLVEEYPCLLNEQSEPVLYRTWYGILCGTVKPATRANVNKATKAIAKSIRG